MFSLIITIISIALVAVLALATLYYGGDAFNRGSSDAQAAKIVNQGQQLLGAAEMFFVDYKRYPNSVAELLNAPNGEHYLKHAPVALEGHGTVSEAWAASAWEVPTAGAPMFVATVDATDACQAINKRTIGMDGILAQAHDSLVTQCYGSDVSNLKAVVSKNRTAFDAVLAANPLLMPAADITSAALPTSDPGPGWLAGYEPRITSAAVPVGGPVGGSEAVTEDITATAGMAAGADGIDGTADDTFQLGGTLRVASFARTYFRITNNTGSPLSITSIEMPPPGMFNVTFTPGDDCSSIPVGGTCYVGWLNGGNESGTSMGSLLVHTNQGVGSMFLTGVMNY